MSWKRASRVGSCRAARGWVYICRGEWWGGRALPYYSGKPLKGLKPSGLNSKGIILVTMIYRLGDGASVRLRLRVEAETIWGLSVGQVGALTGPWEVGTLSGGGHDLYSCNKQKNK